MAKKDQASVADGNQLIASRDNEPATDGGVSTEPATEEASDIITVTVPKPFQLRLDNDALIKFEAGIQEMERRFAEHWYALAHGVEAYVAKIKL